MSPLTVAALFLLVAAALPAPELEVFPVGTAPVVAAPVGTGPVVGAPVVAGPLVVSVSGGVSVAGTL